MQIGVSFVRDLYQSLIASAMPILALLIQFLLGKLPTLKSQIDAGFAYLAKRFAETTTVWMLLLACA